MALGAKKKIRVDSPSLYDPRLLVCCRCSFISSCLQSRWVVCCCYQRLPRPRTIRCPCACTKQSPSNRFLSPFENFRAPRTMREETTSLSSRSQAFPFFCFDSTADSSDSSARGISHRPRLPCEAETRPGTMDNCDPEVAPFELLDTDV
jgi:hypothetical protein